MKLSPGETLRGFEVQSTQELPEINGFASILIHAKSGAKLLYLDNDDDDKAFSIAFRTPPADDTGVFHILEHSVLNGSARFDVKEPFVNLLKSSMQTFLNAMTFPDKTMYPVASTNDADLINLVDVYMDAVLHPNIYRKPEIFWQEGWHYETAPATPGSQEDATEAPQERLIFNGVVFNEMKGVFSEADSVLYQGLQGALLPDTCYRFESGGAPSSIPELTYERFLEEHSRHYRLDNSYITLYGNLDLERMLAFLDERYLSPFADEQQAADEQALAEGREVLLPRSIEMQQPIDAGYTAIPMATAQENACIGCGFVAGTATERTKMVALDILIDAILGSNEAPLKRALLDANISADAGGFLADGLLQPFAVIKLRGAKPNSAEAFQEVIRKTCTELAEGALDHDLLEASLSHTEFTLRENDFGISSGVSLAMTALSSWLYDDSEALTYLRYEDLLADLRSKLDTTWWEDLLREVFLDNPHVATVEVVPDQSISNDAQEAARLAEIAQQFGEEGMQNVKDQLARLRAVQEAPDTAEGLASLPRLSRADLAQPAARPAITMLADTPLPCLRHEAPSNGIAYVYRYFDLDRFDYEELSYIGLLSKMLGKLDTAAHTASQLDTLVNGKLGNLGFGVTVFEPNGNREPEPKLCVSASALESNIDYLVSLEKEILTQTDFSDHARIGNILNQLKAGMEVGFANSGHAAAMGRVASHYLPAALVTEKAGGVELYRLVKHLLATFAEDAAALSERLTDLCARLFTDDAQVVTFTGSGECFDAFWDVDPRFGRESNAAKRLELPEPQPKNEAFIVPSDVTFSALGYDRSLIEPEHTGVWGVASRIIGYEYLWNEVRVKGGAYGSGFQHARNGNTRFYSYRDPHIDQTVEAFKKTGEWLESYEPSSDDMDGFVVASVAAVDKPLKARGLARTQDLMFFEGITEDERLKRRQQMVEAQAGDIRALAPIVSQGCKESSICVFGSKEIIEASKLELETIDLLGE